MPRKPIQTTLRQAYKKLIKPRQFMYFYDYDTKTWYLTNDHELEQGDCQCNDQGKHEYKDSKKLCRNRYSWKDLVVAEHYDHTEVIASIDFGMPVEVYDDCIVAKDIFVIKLLKMVECKSLLNQFKSTKRR